MRDDAETERTCLKDSGRNSNTAQPGSTSLHDTSSEQTSSPTRNMLAMDSTERQGPATTSDQVIIANHEPFETPTTAADSATNATRVQDAERNEADAKSDPTISLLCQPAKFGRDCHACMWLAGETDCDDCSQDLSKLAIFETLVAMNNNSARDSGKLGHEQALKLPGTGSKTSVILFCPKAGLCHACMAYRGWGKCSFCEMDFSMLSSFFNAPDKKNDPGTDKLEGKNPQGQSIVSHIVQYMDTAGIPLGDIRWPGPFDLTEARLGALKNTNDSAAFEIITRVGTSIQSASDYQYARLDKGVHSIIGSESINLNISTTAIRILSAEIIKNISSVVSYYPSVHLGGLELLLMEPYDIIAHHLQQLESIQNSSEHTKRFLETIQELIFKNRIKMEKERNANGLCTFPMLWLLYRPGETVYCEKDGDLYAHVVKAVQSPTGILSSSKWMDKPYIIHAWNLEFDGKYVGRCMQYLWTIEPFEGERVISSLKVVPCQYIDQQDGGRTRERLQSLGRQWYEMLPGRAIQYSGLVKTLPGKEKQLDGRVYVDCAAYYSSEIGEKQVPSSPDMEDMGSGTSMSCSCPSCKGRRPHPPPNFRWASYDVLDPFSEAHKDLEDLQSPEGPLHRYLLASRQIYGLALKSRQWEKLDIASCLPLKPSAVTIDKLVMPSERKEMIKALVYKFAASNSTKDSVKPWTADFVESKGEGKIFLLHGGPGVGKTYTAECIAEYTGRPLLSLTSGDIGTDEEKMESKLSTWFQLAEKWGAVMLIDEADVYLEQRHITDLKRNSLVSVFLRSIEYYKGILFLTTNRVGSFDDAFVSRIHVVIKYDKLGLEERRKIWQQFFDKLEEERDDFVIASRAKDYVLEDEMISKVEWNGREIRNIFQTAVALAEYRFSQNPAKGRPALEKKDIEQVCLMTRQFKQYLEELHGANEDDRAALYRNRAPLSGSSDTEPGADQSRDARVYRPRPRD